MKRITSIILAQYAVLYSLTLTLTLVPQGTVNALLKDTGNWRTVQD